MSRRTTSERTTSEPMTSGRTTSGPMTSGRAASGPTIGRWGRWPGRNPLVAAGAATAVLAAGLAAWSGWSWYDAAHDDSAAYARARDQVLAAGSRARRT